VAGISSSTHGLFSRRCDALLCCREPEGPLRGSRVSLGSQMSLNSETSLAEYEADYGKFNEEGSFIGAYKGDQRTPGHATNV
jgi:hypothetical protein